MKKSEKKGRLKMKNKKLASRNLLRRAENQARGTTQIAAKFLAAASDPDRSYPLTRANGRRLLAKRNVFGPSTRKRWACGGPAAGLHQPPAL